MEYKFADEMNWREQFKMLKRWYYRIRDGVDNDKDDFYFAFFITCHQFKDWLVRDGVATAKEVDDCIEQSDALKLCADVATFSKHARVGREARTGDSKTNAVGQKYMAASSGVMGSTLKIESGGKTIYANLELVSECLDSWYKFLVSKKLEVPETLAEATAHIYEYPMKKWEPKP